MANLAIQQMNKDIQHTGISHDEVELQWEESSRKESLVGKFGKLNVFGCFNWIGWETGKEKMILETSHGVLGMGMESNCKHDQQNNLLHEQILFKCKLPKVCFLLEFLAA